MRVQGGQDWAEISGGLSSAADYINRGLTEGRRERWARERYRGKRRDRLRDTATALEMQGLDPANDAQIAQFQQTDLGSGMTADALRHIAGRRMMGEGQGDERHDVSMKQMRANTALTGANTRQRRAQTAKMATPVPDAMRPEVGRILANYVRMSPQEATSFIPNNWREDVSRQGAAARSEDQRLAAMGMGIDLYKHVSDQNFEMLKAGGNPDFDQNLMAQWLNNPAYRQALSGLQDWQTASDPLGGTSFSLADPTAAGEVMARGAYHMGNEYGPNLMPGSGMQLDFDPSSFVRRSPPPLPVINADDREGYALYQDLLKRGATPEQAAKALMDAYGIAPPTPADTQRLQPTGGTRAAPPPLGPRNW